MLNELEVRSSNNECHARIDVVTSRELTPRNRVLFEKLTVAKRMKIFNVFKEPEGSLPYIILRS